MKGDETRMKRTSQITRIKILHDTNYKLIQKASNNYISNILMLGGKIDGSPQMNLRHLDKKTVEKLKQNLIQHNKKYLKQLTTIKVSVYKEMLTKFSKVHPDLHLSVNTPMKMLNFYGFNNLIKQIQVEQQKQSKQIKEKIVPLSAISADQYYMKIVYSMPLSIYKISKKFL